MSRAVVHVVDGRTTVGTVRFDGAVPALFVVDALARLGLAARRLGWSVLLDDADDDVGACAGLALEALGQAEDLEEAGVEEVVQTDQPPA
jgi:hypothetical protein